MKLLKRQNKRGFTIVEVMCVLVIISIVSSIAMPAINNFHSAERCKAEASVLVSYIRQAKYQALQDNCLNRLIFSKEGSSANAFKIQRYDPDSSTNSTFETIIETDEHDNNRYINDDWKTIADEDEIVFNSSVEVDLSKCSSINAIYFKPDGFLYCFDNSVKKLTSEQTIVFRYGSSAVAVDINALGVISSEAIPNEEDENYFGEGADTDTNTDTGTESD